MSRISDYYYVQRTLTVMKKSAKKRSHREVAEQALVALCRFYVGSTQVPREMTPEEQARNEALTASPMTQEDWDALKSYGI